MSVKINVNEIKNGATFLYNEDVYMVLSSEHSKSGRGQAHVKIKAKNLTKDSTQILGFTGGDKVEKAFIEKANAQFIYKDDSNLNFMNNETFEQISMSIEKLSWENNFLKEGLMVKLLIYEGQILNLELDTNVTLKVSATTDAVRGNTVTNATKQATLETGYTLDVPQFIKNDDLIIVNTETGKYVSKG